MADGSSGNQGQIFQWQCMHCPQTYPGIRPDMFDFCPKCGKEQKKDPLIPEITCINPECKVTLFSEKAEICHKCKKPQKQNPAAVMPTDSSKHGSVEEHKLNIAKAVESRKQQSQESEAATKLAPSPSGAGKLMTTGNQSAAEPHKGGAQFPPDASTLKQGVTPENPIVIDPTNETIPDKGMSTEATVTGPNSKVVNKSDAEGTTEHAKDEGNAEFQDEISANVNVDEQKTDNPPNGTPSHASNDPAAAKEKGTQDQPPGDPKQNPNSGVSSPDSGQSIPDPNSPRSTGSGVPDKDLARMSIDDVRPQNRKRNLEGHEGDGECPPEDTGGSSTPASYAAAAKTPATTTQPSQTQSSVPPIKKQRNNTSNDSAAHGSTADQGNKTTSLSNTSLNQSSDVQVCPNMGLCSCVILFYIQIVCVRSSYMCFW